MSIAAYARKAMRGARCGVVKTVACAGEGGAEAGCKPAPRRMSEPGIADRMKISGQAFSTLHSGGDLSVEWVVLSPPFPQCCTSSFEAALLADEVEVGVGEMGFEFIAAVGGLEGEAERAGDAIVHLGPAVETAAQLDLVAEDFVLNLKPGVPQNLIEFALHGIRAGPPNRLHSPSIYIGRSGGDGRSQVGCSQGVSIPEISARVLERKRDHRCVAAGLGAQPIVAGSCRTREKRHSGSESGEVLTCGTVCRTTVAI